MNDNHSKLIDRMVAQARLYAARRDRPWGVVTEANLRGCLEARSREIEAEGRRGFTARDDEELMESFEVPAWLWPVLKALLSLLSVILVFV